MKEIKISKSKARKFLIKYQNLDGSSKLEGKDGVLHYFNKVGCIQYDPLNVVGRNSDLVLQSRIREYKPDILQEMLYTDRSLIDGWDKMMSIYKAEDWYKFYRVREQSGKEIEKVLKYRNSSESLNFIDDIYQLISDNGPMQSNKINLGSAGKSIWGHRKVSSAAMDYMFHTGKLGIYDKNNTQKIYNLIENLLPEDILNCPDPFENDKDFLKWYVKRRIGSIGMLWARRSDGWLGYFLSNKSLRTPVIKELVEENSLISISIEEFSDTFYIRQEDLEILESINDNIDKEVKFLAPLDNLLWDRNIIEQLFDFSYRWEVYVPASKRKFGYYVLPVLFGDKFIGRFEAENHRGNQPLVIKNWWWEKDVEVTNDMKQAIIKSLQSFCNYLQAEKIEGDILDYLKA